MAKIRLLDKQVAELIAAGEVVERPASVIKELMENSIDAGAKHITVEILDGGVSYMRITDDGCGMSQEDVPTAFLRHATSKIGTEKDLDAIATLGFRGEALASVAAVAKVELTTCADGEIAGTRYVIHGGEEQCIEDAGCPQGTTIVVENLFYNIPARMKFLKKDVSEGNAVAGVVERLALSHPEIAVKFIRGSKTDLQTVGDGNLLNTVRSVFGKPFAMGLIPLNYEYNGVKVEGYVCKPEAGRQNRTMQHFFVNGRYVKTQTAMIALERAYKGVMMAGKFPTCVMFITIPPATVDANIHPAKLEVRFINEKPVFDGVFFGVKSAIEKGDTIHRVLIKEETVASAPVSQPKPVVSVPKNKQPAFSSTAFSGSFAAQKEKPVPPKGPSFIDIAVDDRPVGGSLSLADDTGKKSVSMENLTQYVPTAFHPEQKSPSRNEVKKTETPAVVIHHVEAEQSAESVENASDEPQQLTLTEEKPPITVLGEVFHTYIVAQMGDSVFFIDKHAAHERILYNELKKNERADEQMLLTPVTVGVSSEEQSALLENTDILKEAGMEIEDFGAGMVLVRSFPMILAGKDIEGTVQEIAGGLAQGGREVESSKLDWIYHSCACRAATKGGMIGIDMALQDLAQKVLWESSIRYCPHGRPVCMEMTKKDFDKQFGRTGA